MLTHWIKWLIILYKKGKKYLPFKQNLTFVLSVYFSCGLKSIQKHPSVRQSAELCWTRPRHCIDHFSKKQLLKYMCCLKSFSGAPPVWNSVSQPHIFQHWTSGCEVLNVYLCSFQMLHSYLLHFHHVSRLCSLQHSALNIDICESIASQPWNNYQFYSLFLTISCKYFTYWCIFITCAEEIHILYIYDNEQNQCICNAMNVDKDEIHSKIDYIHIVHRRKMETVRNCW